MLSFNSDNSDQVAGIQIPIEFFQSMFFARVRAQKFRALAGCNASFGLELEVGTPPIVI